MLFVGLESSLRRVVRRGWAEHLEVGAWMVLSESSASDWLSALDAAFCVVLARGLTRLASDC